MYSHVFLPNHFELFSHLCVSALDDKLVREYVSQFSAISIATPNYLLFIVVIVTACQ